MKRLLSTEEAVAILGVSRSVFYRWRAQFPELTPRLLGGTVPRFTEEQIAAFAERVTGYSKRGGRRERKEVA